MDSRTLRIRMVITASMHEPSSRMEKSLLTAVVSLESLQLERI